MAEHSLKFAVQMKTSNDWPKEKNIGDHHDEDKQIAAKIRNSLIKRYDMDRAWRTDEAPIKMRQPRRK